MNAFQVFVVLISVGIVGLLSVCVVFLAVTAYALSIAVIVRPDVDESMKSLPRKYVLFSSRVMAAPSRVFLVFVKITVVGLVFTSIIFWARFIG